MVEFGNFAFHFLQKFNRHSLDFSNIRLREVLREQHIIKRQLLVTGETLTDIQMIGRMIFMILFIMLSPCRAGIAAQLKLSLICFLRRKENSAASGRKAYPLRCPMFAYGVMPVALMFSRMSAVHFLQRQRKVTICALVQCMSGLKRVALVPLVMSSSTAHRTALA